MILISFFVNSAHLPAIGESYRSTSDNLNEIRVIREKSKEKALENNVNPQELIDLYHQKENIAKQATDSSTAMLSHVKPVIYGNLYLIGSRVDILNPFSPLPCEIILTLCCHKTNYCRYYISEESYNFIKEDIIQQEQEMGTGGLVSMFSIGPPPYKKISFIGLFIHGIILIMLVYLIVCLVSFGRVKLLDQNKRNKLIINALLIILPILISFVFGSIYLLFLIPLVVVFAISSLIKNERHNRLFLYILSGIFIVLLIAGIFVAGFIFEMSFGSMNNKDMSVDYAVVQCENAKILSLEEKEELGIQYEHLNEEWNVCYDPTCSDICDDHCSGKRFQVVTMLRGDNPSCICGC